MRRMFVGVVVCISVLSFRSVQAQDTTILPGDDPSTITLQNETGNNTSACSAVGNPSYCTEALPDLETSVGNQSAGAQTKVVDAFPEHVSTINVHRLLYPGWTGQLICEYQPWFSTSTGNNGHILIGYDENNTATVAKQDTVMINRGCNINWIDFYGTTDSNQTFNKQTTDAVFTDLLNRANNPLKFGILEDKGAFKTACNGQGTEQATISCIEADLEADMDYIHSQYANTSVYWMDQGKFVVGYFGSCGDFSLLNCTQSPTDWDTIWSAVQSYTDAHSYNFKYVFQYGAFNKPIISAGEYAWPQPFVDNMGNFVDDPSSQFWWCDGTGITCDGSSAAYLDRFYNDGATNFGSEMTIGLLYSGFDDSNASWGTDRVIAQQCGQILLDTANEVGAGGFWGTGNQIPYMQVATWNDYEEGSEVESGVDNCYTQVNLSLSNSTIVNWTLTSQDSTYSTLNTIHHFALWTAPHNGATLTLRAQLAANKTSFDLSTLHLAHGNYDVYMEMIGQPLIQNEMSAKLPYMQQ